MKKEILEILRCPVCLGEFDLEVSEEKEEILRGTLICKKCGRKYKIEEGIP
ncbi:MAG: Trm112 family protein, partial [Thermoplasmata archaeon]